MPITAQAPYGTFEFPDGTDMAVIKRVMKHYAELQPATPELASSLWEGIKHGMGNTVIGMRQMAAHVGIGPESASQADRAAIEREQAYRGPFAPGPGRALSPARAHPFAAGTGEFVGEGLSTAPLAALPGGQEALALRLGTRVMAGPVARIIGGAAAGGLGAATQPAIAGNDTDYWRQKRLQMTVGGALGGAMGAAGAMMSPTLSPEARTMRSAGVRLTAGQRAASTPQAAERALQTFPIVRGYVDRLVGRSLEDFDRAVARQALEPLGAIVPRSVKAGHDLMKFATNALDTAYDRIKPYLTLSHHGVAAAIQNNQSLQQLIAELPDDLQRRFTTILQNRVLGRFPANGQIDGEMFKTIESYLSRRAASFAGTNDAELGEALNGTLAVLRDELATQNPAVAPELKKINSAYAMFTRLRDAAGRRSAASGIFTPADLLASLKQMDRSAGHGDFARGDALMQVLAEAGQKTIAGSFINRTERLRWGDLIAGAVALPLYVSPEAGRLLPGMGRTIGALTPAAGAFSARQEPPPLQ